MAFFLIEYYLRNKHKKIDDSRTNSNMILLRYILVSGRSIKHKPWSSNEKSVNYYLLTVILFAQFI